MQFINNDHGPYTRCDVHWCRLGASFPQWFIRPSSFRSLQVFSRIMGRQNPDTSRYEARRPCVPEMGFCLQSYKYKIMILRYTQPVSGIQPGLGRYDLSPYFHIFPITVSSSLSSTKPVCYIFSKYPFTHPLLASHPHISALRYSSI